MQNAIKRTRRERDGVTAAAIITAGEVFRDGSMIELFSGGNGRAPQLILLNGANQTIGPLAEHDGLSYEPVRFHDDLSREMTLPTGIHPHGSTRELLTETCRLIANFAGLSEKFASVIGRCAMSSWVITAVRVAPTLVIVGPDEARADQLLAVLHCLCRRALRLTGVTPASFCSLPSGVEFTFIINQPKISDALAQLLRNASRRDEKIPSRGRLLDFFGAQIIRSECPISSGALSVRSIQIPMIPGVNGLPPFDLEVRRRVAAEFQSKFLSFRRTNLAAAEKLQFDASKFVFGMREFAHSIAAATPDDAQLQAEVFDLLQDENSEARDRRWIEFSCVALEAIAVAYRESPGGLIYVCDLAETAGEILRRRGEDDHEARVAPAVMGKWLKTFGFQVEARDARGSKLKLTEQLFHRAEQLARDFGAPAFESINSSGGG